MEFIKIDKKIRIAISTAIISFLMLFSTFFFFDKAWFFTGLFIIVAYALTYFSLIEGIEKIEWITLFFMPVVFTVVSYFFFFLFPVRWLWRLPFIIFYSISIYGLFRVSNILNVGVEKSLQLYRAAFSVNYLFHTITIFFLTNFIFSLKYDPFINGLIIFIIGFIWAVNFFWTIKLDLFFDRKVIIHGLLIAIVLTEEIVCFSFLPFETSILALLVTATYYSLTGLTYSWLDERFFKEIIREYIIILIIVLLISFITLIRW